MKRILLAAVAATLMVGSLGVGQAATKKKSPPVVDKKPPVVRIDTQDGAKIASVWLKDQVGDLPTGKTLPSYGQRTPIEGRATDNLSGVKSVTLTFKYCKIDDWSSDQTGSNDHKATCGKGTTPDNYRNAALTTCLQGCSVPIELNDCASKKRLSCSWTTYAPSVPGVYLVSATAIDVKGNKGYATAINILVY